MRSDQANEIGILGKLIEDLLNHKNAILRKLNPSLNASLRLIESLELHIAPKNDLERHSDEKLLLHVTGLQRPQRLDFAAQSKKDSRERSSRGYNFLGV